MMPIQKDKPKPATDKGRLQTPPRIRTTRDRRGSRSPSFPETDSESSEHSAPKTHKRPIYDQLGRWEEENTVELAIDLATHTATAPATGKLLTPDRTPNKRNGQAGKADKYSTPNSAGSKRKLEAVSREHTPAPASSNSKKRRAEQYEYNQSSPDGNWSSPINAEHQQKKIKVPKRATFFGKFSRKERNDQ